MSRFDSPLNNLKIASPCPTDWEAMYGDDRKRFCGQCKLNVYNLSGMTTDEAEALIMNAEGRLCVRFYQRADGTVLTSDCPVGWARVKQRTRATLAAAGSLLIALFTGVLFVSLFSRSTRTTVGELRIPFTTSTPEPVTTMGAISIRPQDTNSNTKHTPEQRPTMGNVAPQKAPASEQFKIGKIRVMEQERPRPDVN